MTFKILKEKTSEKKAIFISYTFIALLLFLIHLLFKTGTHDDAWFAEMLNLRSLSDYLVWRYQEWSSRIPIEAAFVLFTHWHPLVWRITNTLMILLLIHSISQIFVWKNQHKYIIPISILLALIPLGMLHSAGWITSTICYVWTASLGLYALIPLRRWFDGKSLKGYEYITVTLALCFASSQEQAAAILLCSYLLCGLALYQKEKKLPVFWWIIVILCILSVVNIIFCPGNAIRNEVTIQNSFPEFPYLTFGQKFYLGFISTFSFFVGCEGFNMIFLALVGTLAISIFYRDDNLGKTNLSFIPFLTTLILGLFSRIGMKNGWFERFYFIQIFQNNELQQFTGFKTSHLLLQSLLFILILICTLIELYWIFGKTKRCLLAYMIFFAGIASRLIMGFTPSLYISAARTALFACIAFLILILLIIQESDKINFRKGYLCFISSFYILLLIGTLLLEDLTHSF